MTERHRAQPSANHRDHDHLLIARSAGGDPLPGEADRARTLIEACAECAALAADLRRLTSAMASLPVPRRTRDFRISAEQARALRGSWLDRVMRRVASPGLGVVQPLAGAVMSIGIVLVVAGATLPTPSLMSGEDGDRQVAPLSLEAGPTALPELAAEATEGPAAAPPAEATKPPERYAPNQEYSVTSPGAPPDAAPLGGTDEGEAPASSPVFAAGDVGDASATTAPRRTDVTGREAPEASLQDAASVRPSTLLIAVGGGLALLGVLLIGIRWMARRSTADPLLR